MDESASREVGGAALTLRLTATSASGRLTRTQPSGRTANCIDAATLAGGSPS
jgi:hypothetical protein